MSKDQFPKQLYVWRDTEAEQFYCSPDRDSVSGGTLVGVYEFTLMGVISTYVSVDPTDRPEQRDDL